MTGPSAAHDQAETVSPKFNREITNIPGKSLIAVEVDYAPGAVHSVSRNASRTEPAKLLAVFVVDSDDQKLTTPVQPH